MALAAAHHHQQPRHHVPTENGRASLSVSLTHAQGDTGAGPSHAIGPAAVCCFHGRYFFFFSRSRPINVNDDTGAAERGPQVVIDRWAAPLPLPSPLEEFYF